MFTLENGTLKHPNLKNRTLTFVGKGTFASAYRYKNVVYILTNDITKYILSQAPRHPNLPHIIHIGTVMELYQDNDYHNKNNIYVMPYYQHFEPNEEEIPHFKEISDKLIFLNVNKHNCDRVQNNNPYYPVILTITNLFNQNKNQKYQWDIGLRNIKRKKYGTPVIIDPVCCL